LLVERQFPIRGDLRILATERSAGTTVDLVGREITVERADGADYRDLDIVFNTASSGFSAENAEAIHAQGPVIIDSSSDWRKDPRVPLLIPEVNPDALDDADMGIVAKPNCTTTMGVLAINYLHEQAGLQSLGVSTYQSVSGMGEAGIRANQNQVQAMATRVDELIDGQLHPYPETGDLPAITAFNVAALAGTFEVGDDHTTEERKFMNETRKIFQLSPEQLPIDVTCGRIDVFNCHALSILAEFKNEITVEQAHEIFSGAAAIQLHEREDVPQPIHVAGTDPVHVGRVRQSEKYGTRGLNFWVVADNLRIGAALNAVKIAELLIR
jgi:aspartate-semialdehyde dehydrogenase